jgi:cardiolipin synthase
MNPAWTSEEVFFNGDQYFERLMEDIGRARELITVEMYIFNDDELGNLLASCLIAAHQRGVKVQILIDGVGSYGFEARLAHRFKEAGVMVKYFNPLPFLQPFYGQLSFARKVNVFLNRVLRMNQRNHRKIITIDHEILFTGSFNFASEHTHYSHSEIWKDMGVRTSGPLVKFAILNFKRNWKFRDFVRYKKQFKGTKVSWRYTPLRLNHTLIMKRYFYKEFIRRINKSQRRVWFITPYFIPKRSVIKALGKAANRGVDVRILISRKSDVWLFETLQTFYYPYLIKAGVKVFHYTDTVLHAKNYIIDDWTTVGSTNLNHRSLLHDMEVDVVIQQKENLKLIEENFLASCEKQPMVSMDELSLRPLKQKFLTQLFFIFRYWL